MVMSAYPLLLQEESVRRIIELHVVYTYMFEAQKASSLFLQRI